MLGFAGAVVILLGLWGLAARLAGLGAIIAATILTAPHARRPAVLPGWWSTLATGAVLVLAGTAVALGLETVGGLALGLGAILVVVAISFAPR